MDSINQFNQILQTLTIKAKCVDSHAIDNYFYYDLKLSPQARVRDVHRYGDEISLALRTPCRPSIKVLHDRGVVRLEFVTPRNSPLRLLEYFTNEDIPEGDLI